jgi:hypothetical protein
MSMERLNTKACLLLLHVAELSCLALENSTTYRNGAYHRWMYDNCLSDINRK